MTANQSTDAVGAMLSGAKIAPAGSTFEIPKGGIFSRAVVLQTLNDPSLRDPEKDAALISTLKNKQLYLRAPRNSLICRLISDRKGFVENSDLICFPFFSSHFMLPVKAGEQVWLFMEIADYPYWLSRIPEPIHVEDVNFTHGDRRINRDFKGELTGSAADDGSGNFDEERKLKFQNGMSGKSDLATILGNESAFLNLITGSKESNFTSFEPVPRLTKRPGDLVIQGSNNTAIRLGTEMGWSVDANSRPLDSTEKSQASTVSPDEKLGVGLGAIDIVVGRGRYFQDSSAEKSASGKKQGKGQNNTTRPYIEQNEINGCFETDKNVGVLQEKENSKKFGNFKTNAQEGDPDFLMDASRVYVSNKSEIDKMLGTGPLGVAKAFDPDSAITDQVGPSVAIKSDHIRLVARKLPHASNIEPDDAKNLNPPSNGSIRIVKEGTPGEDLASITIEADGTIHISGSRIYFGRNKDDGGADKGKALGNSQPYVRYQQLEDLLTKTYDDLKKFVQKLQTNFSTNSTPGFGGPNPALIKSAAEECTELLSAIDSRKKEIETLKSERIFGE